MWGRVGWGGGIRAEFCMKQSGFAGGWAGKNHLEGACFGQMAVQWYMSTLNSLPFLRHHTCLFDFSLCLSFMGENTLAAWLSSFALQWCAGSWVCVPRHHEFTTGSSVLLLFLWQQQPRESFSHSLYCTCSSFLPPPQTTPSPYPLAFFFLFSWQCVPSFLGLLFFLHPVLGTSPRPVPGVTLPCAELSLLLNTYMQFPVFNTDQNVFWTKTNFFW
jgi:hypothetical protein